MTCMATSQTSDYDSYSSYFSNSHAGDEDIPEDPSELPDIAEPVVLQQGNFLPQLSEPSTLLDDRQCNALAAAVPIRHRWRQWTLAYSTARDGISLQTLYRYSPDLIWHSYMGAQRLMQHQFQFELEAIKELGSSAEVSRCLLLMY